MRLCSASDSCYGRAVHFLRWCDFTLGPTFSLERRTSRLHMIIIIATPYMSRGFVPMSVTFLRSELTRVSIVQLQCSGGTPVDVAGGSNGILVIDDGIIVGPHGAMCVCDVHWDSVRQEPRPLTTPTSGKARPLMQAASTCPSRVAVTVKRALFCLALLFC